VVIVLLTAGETDQRASLTWSLPPDGGGDVVPVTGAAADLRLVGPDGTIGQFLPDPDSAGIFRTRLKVEPRGRYRIEGAIDARRVGGTTSVPGPMTVTFPTDGLLRMGPIEPSDAGPVGRIRYRVHSEGTAVVGLVDPRFGGTMVAAGDTAGEWTVPAVVLTEPVTPMLLDGYDAAAAGFFFRKTWTTNLVGAVGVLGSRIRTPAMVARP
jgi:hypothetical protein